MTNNNDMVTLNIYNSPPQLADTSNGNINETDYNLNTDKPQMNQKYYDNIRNDLPQNYNSAPRTQYPKKNNVQSSIDESSSDSTENNPNNTPVIPPPAQYPQFKQPIYQQMPVQPVAVATPMANPVVYPYNYNTPYGQPIVIQQQRHNNNKNRPVNNAPKTIIIREREPERRRSSEEDCCAGCLAGFGACLACCCLMGLCCPGPHGPHRYGRW
jgi:hypothetical protein